MPDGGEALFRAVAYTPLYDFTHAYRKYAVEGRSGCNILAQDEQIYGASRIIFHYDGTKVLRVVGVRPTIWKRLRPNRENERHLFLR